MKPTAVVVTALSIISPSLAALAAAGPSAHHPQVSGPITMWVQPHGAHGELVDIAEFILDWPSMMDGADRPVTGGNVLYTVEIFEVPDPGMEPAPQDVNDLLSDAPPVPVDDVYDTSSVPVTSSSTPTTQA